MPNATAVEIQRKLAPLSKDSPDCGGLHLALAQNTDSLDRLIGCNYRSLVFVPRHPGWTFKNPSISLNPSGGYYCAVRYSSWPMVKGFASHSELIIATLNDEFETVNVKYVPQLTRPIAAPYYSSFGPEDARLFRVYDQWFATATFRDLPECRATPEFFCCMGLMSLDADFNWTNLTVLPSPVVQDEKNWMPIVGELAWLYSPFNTLRCWINPQTKKLSYAPPVWTPPELKFTRGGTHIVPINEDYALGVVHETVLHVPNSLYRQHGYHRAYMHRFVLWRRDPFCVAAFSPPFHFLTQCSVEFAAGLALKDGKLLISFGHHDNASWVAEVQLADVQRILQPAQ